VLLMLLPRHCTNNRTRSRPNTRYKDTSDCCSAARAEQDVAIFDILGGPAGLAYSAWAVGG